MINKGENFLHKKNSEQGWNENYVPYWNNVLVFICFKQPWLGIFLLILMLLYWFSLPVVLQFYKVTPDDAAHHANDCGTLKKKVKGE